ncbi:MAG: DUF1688 family protein [Acidimicrobiales bacterium]|nr:MAG: DUF1688 family protein [Acidimicrobiales bacterium]
MTALPHSAAELLSAAAVRSQSARVTDHVRAGRGHFELHEDKLDVCAEFVASTTRARYPDLDIPYHSRWRHFSAPGSTLQATYEHHEEALDERERARAGFDLIVPSVLLDAGAGAVWSYLPDGCDERIGRSEGLGLASLGMFLAGQFSSSDSMTTDASALTSLTEEQLNAGFQISDANPLLGVGGRLAMMQGLGRAILERPEVFPHQRPGDLVDHLVRDSPVRATAVLDVVLDVLAPIWPDRLEVEGVRLGDSWFYEPFGTGVDAIIPFHKLSQWLTYSLVETLERVGIDVDGVESLTGLPEYRNGGLLYETGVIGLRDPSLAVVAHQPGSPVIVEWRALTITLLDEIAGRVKTVLGRPEMLLAEILEGGTWAAGRALAYERDPLGTPPLTLESDGTVF